MRVVQLLALGVIVLAASLGNGNAVTAAATPDPDPCSIIFGRPYPRRIPTTTAPPKTEEQIALEARKAKVKQFETLLEEFLLWGPAPVPTLLSPAPPPPPPPPALELQPETPKSQPGFNAMFDNDFLTKMVQFILY